MNAKIEFSFHPEASRSIDAGGRKLLGKISELILPKKEEPEFRSERPIAAAIDRSKMVEDPFLSATSSDGKSVLAFIFRDEKVYGIEDNDLVEVKNISSQILKAKWANSTLGDKFVEETILRWCRASFGLDDCSELSQEVVSRSEKFVQRRTMWAPIANLEVESAFEFGSVTIEPITQSMIDQLKQSSIKGTPAQANDIAKLFERVREKTQGLAAVVCDFDAEPGYAFEKGLAIANNAVGLLRFFSPSSYISSYTCLNAPLGSEFVPSMSIILLSEEGGFSWKEGILLKGPYSWSISNRDLSRLKDEGLMLAAKLLNEEGLSPFAKKVRSSILSYTKGITLADTNDRLVYKLSSLEGLFLRNSSEPIQQNLGERLAFLIASDSSTRKNIVRNTREIYNMRSQYVHHRNSILEVEAFQEFTWNARRALMMSLHNIENFKSVEEFHDAIDERKFG